MGFAALALTVRLISAGSVPGYVLSDAKYAAGDILKTAGVRVIWQMCRAGAPCAGPVGRGVMVVRVSGEVPEGHRGDTAGYAVLGAEENHAVVSYPRAVATADGCGNSASMVLGAAIAHEVGHLLLGPAHTESGIMAARLRCGDLTRAARGELRFSAEESRRIGAVLR